MPENNEIPNLYETLEMVSDIYIAMQQYKLDFNKHEKTIISDKINMCECIYKGGVILEKIILEFDNTKILPFNIEFKSNIFKLTIFKGPFSNVEFENFYNNLTETDIIKLINSIIDIRILELKAYLIQLSNLEDPERNPFWMLECNKQ